MVTKFILSIFMALVCIAPQVANAYSVVISGHNSVGYYEGQPLYLDLTAPLTVATTAGSLRSVFIDDILVDENRGGSWTSYTLYDLDKYQDGDFHKLTIKGGGTSTSEVYGICYFMMKEDISVNGIIYKVIEEEHGKYASVIGAKQSLQNLNIEEAYTLNGKSYPVISVSDKACYCFKNLKTVSFPSSMIEIGNSAFERCSSLESVSFPDITTKIGASAFEWTNLQEVHLPKLLKTLGWGAFRYCFKLRTIKMEECESLTEIPEYAFAGCHLETIDLPPSLIYINNYAFSDCTELKSLLLPPSLQGVHPTAFYNCIFRKLAYPDRAQCDALSRFTHIMYPFTAKIIDGCVYDNTGENTLYYVPTNCMEILLPEKLQTIGSRAFSYCENIENLSLPETLQKIGNEAFYSCEHIKTLSLPESIEEIGDEAFYNCKNLEELSLPLGLKRIGGSIANEVKKVVFNPEECTASSSTGAFNKSNLETLILGKSVKSIPKNCFSSSHISSLTIPSSVSTIEKDAFGYCSQLTSIRIDDSESALEGQDIFYSCSYVSDVYLGRNCHQSIFKSSKKITSIELGSQVTDGRAFTPSAYSDLKRLVSNAPTPPLMETFTQEQYNTMEVVIPEGSQNAYISNSIWRPFWTSTPLSIILSVENLELTDGDMGQLSVTADPVNSDLSGIEWISSDSSIIEVDKDGNYEAKAPGEAVITVKCDGLTAECHIIVNPLLIRYLKFEKGNYSAYIGNEFTILPVIKPENASNPQLSWKSSDETIATVNSEGLVTCVREGKCKISTSTTDGSELTAEYTLTVDAYWVKEVVVTPAQFNGRVGDEMQLEAQLTSYTYMKEPTYTDIEWSSVNDDVATVDSNGHVVLTGVGECCIYATSRHGNSSNPIVKGHCYVSVQPALTMTLNQNKIVGYEGEVVSLIYYVKPDDFDHEDIRLVIEDESVVSMYGFTNTANERLLKLNSEGMTKIRVEIEGENNVFAECDVEVKPFIPISSLEVTPDFIEDTPGGSFALMVDILPENASNKKLSFQSSNPNVAYADNNRVWLLSPGSAAIIIETCDGSELKAYCNIIVKDDSGIKSVPIEDEENVKIFNMSGVLLYEGKYSDINLKEGLYLILTKEGTYKHWIK